jgi:hypothetical protein
VQLPVLCCPLVGSSINSLFVILKRLSLEEYRAVSSRKEHSMSLSISFNLVKASSFASLNDERQPCLSDSFVSYYVRVS